MVKYNGFELEYDEDYDTEEEIEEIYFNFESTDGYWYNYFKASRKKGSDDKFNINFYFSDINSDRSIYNDIREEMKEKIYEVYNPEELLDYGTFKSIFRDILNKDTQLKNNLLTNIVKRKKYDGLVSLFKKYGFYVYKPENKYENGEYYKNGNIEYSTIGDKLINNDILHNEEFIAYSIDKLYNAADTSEVDNEALYIEDKMDKFFRNISKFLKLEIEKFTQLNDIKEVEKLTEIYEQIENYHMEISKIFDFNKNFEITIKEILRMLWDNNFFYNEDRLDKKNFRFGERFEYSFKKMVMELVNEFLNKHKVTSNYKLNEIIDFGCKNVERINNESLAELVVNMKDNGMINDEYLKFIALCLNECSENKEENNKYSSNDILDMLANKFSGKTFKEYSNSIIKNLERRSKIENDAEIAKKRDIERFLDRRQGIEYDQFLDYDDLAVAEHIYNEDYTGKGRK